MSWKYFFNYYVKDMRNKVPQGAELKVEQYLLSQVKLCDDFNIFNLRLFQYDNGNQHNAERTFVTFLKSQLVCMKKGTSSNIYYDELRE